MDSKHMPKKLQNAIFALVLCLWNLNVGNCAQLIIGVFKFAPPYSSVSGDGRHFFGFNIDLMNALCTSIKADCMFKAVELDKQIQSLIQGEVDLIFSASPLGAPTPNNIIFSLPYLPSNGQFMTLKSSAINSITDIRNKNIGVLQNALFQALMQSSFAHYGAIKEYRIITDLIDALASKEVDVIIVNENIAKYLLNNITDKLKPVGNKIALGYGYGILALKKNASLIDKINTALIDLEAGGGYSSIYDKYF